MIQEFLLRIITTNKRHSFLLIGLFYFFLNEFGSLFEHLKKTEKLRSIIFQLEQVADPCNKLLRYIFGHCRQCQFVKISLILRPEPKISKI